MDFYSLNFVTILSAIAGLLSVFVTLLSFLRNRLKETENLKKINPLNLFSAITLRNIKVLGKFIDKNLGAITIKEYVSNKKIHTTVDHSLNRILRYIGTEEDIKKEVVPIPDTEISFNYEIPEELRYIKDEIKVGEYWGAMATLRNYIVTNLIMTFKQYNMGTDKYIPQDQLSYMTPSQLISILSSSQRISQAVARDLRYAISICNKAVHGLKITPEEAEKAVQLAINDLEEIGQKT